MAEKKTTKKRKVAGEKITAREKFAVVKIGGGQELVREGDTLKIPRIEGREGSRFKAKDVLLLISPDKLKIGTPFVAGAEISCEILEHVKGEKVEIRKFRAKSRYRRETGHRQPITKIQVEKIKV